MVEKSTDILLNNLQETAAELERSTDKHQRVSGLTGLLLADLLRKGVVTPEDCERRHAGQLANRNAERKEDRELRSCGIPWVDCMVSFCARSPVVAGVVTILAMLIFREPLSAILRKVLGV
jgi:hypothetical protein